MHQKNFWWYSGCFLAASEDTCRSAEPHRFFWIKPRLLICVWCLAGGQDCWQQKLELPQRTTSKWVYPVSYWPFFSPTSGGWWARREAKVGFENSKPTGAHGSPSLLLSFVWRNTGCEYICFNASLLTTTMLWWHRPFLVDQCWVHWAHILSVGSILYDRSTQPQSATHCHAIEFWSQD